MKKISALLFLTIILSVSPCFPGYVPAYGAGSVITDKRCTSATNAKEAASLKDIFTLSGSDI